MTPRTIEIRHPRHRAHQSTGDRSAASYAAAASARRRCRRTARAATHRPRRSSPTRSALVEDHLDDLVIDAPVVAATPGVVVPASRRSAWPASRSAPTIVPTGYELRRADADEVFRTLAVEPVAERRHNPGLPDRPRRIDHRDVLRDTGHHASLRSLGSHHRRTVARRRDGGLMALRHPSRSTSPIRLYGRRVMLRPLAANDFRSWSEVRDATPSG